MVSICQRIRDTLGGHLKPTAGGIHTEAESPVDSNTGFVAGTDILTSLFIVNSVPIDSIVEAYIFLQSFLPTTWLTRFYVETLNERNHALDLRYHWFLV